MSFTRKILILVLEARFMMTHQKGGRTLFLSPFIVSCVGALICIASPNRQEDLLEE